MINGVYVIEADHVDEKLGEFVCTRGELTGLSLKHGVVNEELRVRRKHPQKLVPLTRLRRMP